MIQVNIKADVDALRALGAGKDFQRKVTIATSRAINRTLMQGRTVARSEVKRLYNIPQRYLDGINFQRSVPYGGRKNASRTLTGTIYASAKPIPMDAFAPKFLFYTPMPIEATFSMRQVYKRRQALADRMRSRAWSPRPTRRFSLPAFSNLR